MMIQQPEVINSSFNAQEHLQKFPLSKNGSGMPWIQVARDSPYFITDQGEDWTPVGQNDAITWPDLQGAFLRKDLSSVEFYLRMLAQHGVTCLRLMLEYCHGEHRYLEKPAGRFQPNMIRMWDDLFMLCEKHGLRILLTPYDTFWMWIRWSHHPYKKSNGGPCEKRTQWLLSKETREAIKQRLAFASQRWGGSGALFAWDLWNEIHPAHAGDSVDCFAEFIEDVGSFLRQTELRLYGRSHPQTVSVFGPVIEKDPRIADCAFRHPALDFASVHFYENNTIDNPKNTVDAAISMGRLTREALAHTDNRRPFFDSEHGPIHAFKDKHKTLPEPFDDEYFRHMQWAHFASGGAGGGMRWPNRHPHSLTAGMRKAQQALVGFLPLIKWQQFRRRNLNNEILLSESGFSAFGCGDSEQAVLWILRTSIIGKKGMLSHNVEAKAVLAQVPGLKPGRYRLTVWNTRSGSAVTVLETDHLYGQLHLPPQLIASDLAFAIRRTGD
jgi:hypothetical protein